MKKKVKLTGVGRQLRILSTTCSRHAPVPSIHSNLLLTGFGSVYVSHTTLFTVTVLVVFVYRPQIEFTCVFTQQYNNHLIIALY